jgi:single-stranded-DNA-specific exonuclease
MSPTTLTSARWTLRRVDRDHVLSLARALRTSEFAATLLIARGIREAEAARAHLEPRLSMLHDPAHFSGMKAATSRIARAIRAGETILVHGDYDVDGVTGTTLLMRLFMKLGARAAWHIPNRFTDGYSFGPHSIEKARASGATLVISVDNGTSALQTIGELRALGIDTIVTDHHEPPPGDLPPALAIINPKLEGCAYPFRELCGGAVAFKLAWGLCQEMSGASKVREDLREFLVEAMGYVAIATVCDVVPLIDENRCLARYGLRSLESSRNPGIQALLSVAKLTGQKLEADDVAFKVGPRINASGRLGSAEKAVALLLAEDAPTAARLARDLDDLNIERKRIESELLVEALREAEPFRDRDEHPVLVVAGQGWHQGVVGIIAARLVAKFQRPAIVIGLDGKTGRGSGRSIAGFSILEALNGGAAHVEKHGGHEQAAGLEVRADKISELRAAVCMRAREMLGSGGYAPSEVPIDCEIPFAAMTHDLMREIDKLKPFGERNERPVFLSSGLRLAEPSRVVGADGTHMMVQLRHGAQCLRAMAFGMAHRAAELKMGADVHALYTPKWNSFRGETKLEIELVDFRVGDRPET